MTKRMRPAFVLTTCAVAAACRTSNPPEPESTGGDVQTATSASASGVTAPSSVAPTTSASSQPVASASASQTAPATPKRKRKGKDTTAKEWKPSKVQWPLEVLHPKDADGHTILVGDDNGCYYETPSATKQSEPFATGMPPPMDRTDVDCPEVFDDPAWDDYRSGWLLAINPKTKQCTFMPRGGNPPPPNLIAKCPKPAPKPKVDPLKKK